MSLTTTTGDVTTTGDLTSSTGDLITYGAVGVSAVLFFVVFFVFLIRLYRRPSLIPGAGRSSRMARRKR